MTAALHYAGRGWPVFPLHTPTKDGGCDCGNKNCSSPGKHPRTKHGMKDATTDEQQIRQWWGQWPYANVAIDTGRAGLVVLDIDRDVGSNNWKELTKKYGVALDRPPTAKTGHGSHKYFLAPPEKPIRNSAGKIAPGIDVRADGGYVVAPPSIHPSGGRYQWVEESLGEWVPLPDVLIRLATSPNGSRAEPSDAEKQGLIPVHERNVTLARLAGSMRRQGFSQSSIEMALLEENRTRCQEPLPEDEVHDIAKSISRYPPAPNLHVVPPNGDGPTYNGPIREDGGHPTFHKTDYGNAELMVAQHKNSFLWCEAWKTWLYWDGARWVRNATGAVERLAKDTIRRMFAEALQLEGDDRDRLIRHATKSEAQPRVNAMMALTKSEKGVEARPDHFDQDPWLFNCRNGTIDLHTGQLRPHLREDFITKLSPVTYNETAQAPVWSRFLHGVMDGNEDKIDFLQVMAGYCLTALIDEEKLFFLYGTGRNGKSKFIGALEYVMGDYAKHTRPETLMSKPNTDRIPNDIAALVGSRLVSTVEVEDGRRLAEGLVKELTGGDKITARFLHGEFFDFDPTFKICFAANHKPVIRGTDNAIWERIVLIPFTVTIPEKERDRRLAEKLRREGSGILRWMVQGCQLWHQRGLKPPQSVQEAIADYRSEMDVLASFIEEKCVISQESRSSAKAIYDAYRAWSESSGEKPVTQRKLGLMLRERGFDKRKTPDRAHSTEWLGIGVQG